MKARAAFALCLTCAATAVSAQAAEPPAPAAVPEKSWTVQAIEIVAFNFLLNRYQRGFSGSSDYHVTAASIRRNLHGPCTAQKALVRRNLRARRRLPRSPAHSRASLRKPGKEQG